MTDDEAIRRTLSEYCRLMDDGRFDEWADLFAGDATFMPLGSLARGRAAIHAWAVETFPDRAQIPRHLTVNPIVDVDGDGAVAHSDVLVVFPSPGGPVLKLVARYHDMLVRDGDRWRFARREVIPSAGWLAPELAPATDRP